MASELDRINAQNRAIYEAAEAAKKQAVQDRKDYNRKALLARNQRMLDTSCGNVEATGNPRKDCVCQTCVRRRTKKTTTHKARRKGDPDAGWDKSVIDRPDSMDRFAKYNITADQYHDMLKVQDYSCAICGTKKPGGRNSRISWHIDHDHSCCPGNSSCGKCVRGLLCRSCNWGLGQFHDSIPKLSAAITYLTQTADK